MAIFKPTNLVKALLSASLAFLFCACSKVNDLEVTMPDILKTGVQTQVKIIRSGEGSGDWDITDKDGFNYYFTSYPARKFEVGIVEGKENEYCRTIGSNEVSGNEMRNEVKRDVLIKENSNGEISIAIACHKQIYQFIPTDSIVSVQMIVEDSQFKVSDTVVFQIVR